MVVRQVEKQSVADHLAAQLKERIITGELAPGQQLPSERDLAEQAGVNRQAVREALQQLRQLGLVEITQGTGVTVLDWPDRAHFSVLYDSFFAPDGSFRLTNVAAVLRMRAIAMADAARLAARRRTDEEMEELERLMQAIEAGPADGPVMPRFEVWERIVDASRNIAHRLTYTSQMNVAVRLPPELLSALSAGATLVSDYRALVDAIRAGDADAAEQQSRIILGAVTALLGDPL